MNNFEAALKSPGVTLREVVRLNFYVTGMKAFMASHHILTERLKHTNAKPPGCAIGVAMLYSPDALIETGATAVA